VTVIDTPPATPTEDGQRSPGGDAQLLFQEAKQRRRRRWLASGIVSLVLVAVLGATFGLVLGRGGGGSLKPAAIPASAIGAGHPEVHFTLRPALCYAPAFALAPGQTPTTGPLPPCAASSALTASNLDVSPQAGNVNGYTSDESIHEDPQFATYPSTPSVDASNSASVLLPGASAAGSGRYVLGPAALTNAAIKSASAQINNGQWSVNLVLTPTGSSEWNASAMQEFHAIIGIDINGRVISAPILQPTQSSFTPFNGQMQISGSFTAAQAKTLASELT